MIIKKFSTIRLLTLFVTFIGIFNGLFAETDYSQKNNWAFFPGKPTDRFDIFFVAPTVFFGNDSLYNMPLNNEELRKRFRGAINMEKGIYDDGNSDFYAPFYRQVGLSCFVARGYNDISQDVKVNDAFMKAYEDVEDAFGYYLSTSDDPFILAGFSQGSEMIIRLLKEKFTDRGLNKRLIAAYCIGWRLTPEDIEVNPLLKPAKSEKDTGCIICYSTESVNIKKSLIVPEFTYSINPLNWSTSSDMVDADKNLGACFTDYSGEILREIPHFTGTYIDSERGTLKVPDVDPKEYPAKLGIFKDGEFHIYDYMFFYRNLQHNVKVRIEEYKKNTHN